MQDAAGYSNTSAGVTRYKEFVACVKKGLGTVNRPQHNDVMRQPTVKGAYDLAQMQQALYMNDLFVDSVNRAAVIPSGDFAAFWILYRDALTNVEQKAWHKVHKARFGNKAKAQNDRTVQEYYASEMFVQQDEEASCLLYPSTSNGMILRTSWLQANVFFANLDPIMKSLLIAADKSIKPLTMEDWKLADIYAEAQAIEQSPEYADRAKARKEAEAMRKQISASAIQVQVAAAATFQRNAPSNGGGAGAGSRSRPSSNFRQNHVVVDDEVPDGINLLNTDIHGTQIRTIDLRKNPKLAAQRYKDLDDHREKWEASGEPLVPGTKGLTERKIKGVMQKDVCKSARSGAGCGKVGHAINNCTIDRRQQPGYPYPNKSEPYVANANTTVAPAIAAQAPAPMAGIPVDSGPTPSPPSADIQRLASLVQAMGQEFGGEIGAEATALMQTFSNCTVTTFIVGGTDTRTHSLIITINGEIVLVDTGSYFTLLSRPKYLRKLAEGTCTPETPADPGVKFVASSGTDLDHTGKTVLDLKIGDVDRPCQGMICDKLAPDFPLLLGLETIVSLDGVIDAAGNNVKFLSHKAADPAAKAIEFKFEPVAVRALVYHPSVTKYVDDEVFHPRAPVHTVPRRKAARKNPNVRPYQQVDRRQTVTPTAPPARISTSSVAWSVSMMFMILSCGTIGKVESASQPYPYNPANEPINPHDTFSDVLGNVPFDTSVELHDKYLDPDLPKPFSDWSPNANSNRNHLPDNGPSTCVSAVGAEYLGDTDDPWFKTTEVDNDNRDSDFFSWKDVSYADDDDGFNTYRHCYDDNNNLVKTEVVDYAFESKANVSATLCYQRTPVLFQNQNHAKSNAPSARASFRCHKSNAPSAGAKLELPRPVVAAAVTSAACASGALLQSMAATAACASGALLQSMESGKGPSTSPIATRASSDIAALHMSVMGELGFEDKVDNGVNKMGAVSPDEDIVNPWDGSVGTKTWVRPDGTAWGNSLEGDNGAHKRGAISPEEDFTNPDGSVRVHDRLPSRGASGYFLPTPASCAPNATLQPMTVNNAQQLTDIGTKYVEDQCKAYGSEGVATARTNRYVQAQLRRWKKDDEIVAAPYVSQVRGLNQPMLGSARMPNSNGDQPLSMPSVVNVNATHRGSKGTHRGGCRDKGHSIPAEFESGTKKTTDIDIFDGAPDPTHFWRLKKGQSALVEGQVGNPAYNSNRTSSSTAAHQGGRGIRSARQMAKCTCTPKCKPYPVDEPHGSHGYDCKVPYREDRAKQWDESCKNEQLTQNKAKYKPVQPTVGASENKQAAMVITTGMSYEDFKETIEYQKLSAHSGRTQLMKEWTEIKSAALCSHGSADRNSYSPKSTEIRYAPKGQDQFDRDPKQQPSNGAGAGSESAKPPNGAGAGSESAKPPNMSTRTSILDVGGWENLLCDTDSRTPLQKVKDDIREGTQSYTHKSRFGNTEATRSVLRKKHQRAFKSNRPEDDPAKLDGEPVIAKVNAAYRDAKGEDLWEQLGLHKNEWAMQPKVQAIMRQALAESGDVFRPNADGSLRHVCHADGSPMLVNFEVDKGASWYSKAYRVSNEWREIVTSKLTEMLEQGLISKNPYSSRASPMLCVPKDDPLDPVRLTIDFRRANMHIRPMCYPLVTCEDIYSRLGGSSRYTVIDFKSWFHQFRLHPDCKEHTTFVTQHMGAFNWNVLPMGLKISPAVVQSMVDNIFRCTYDGPGHYHGKMALGNIVEVYMDDLICHDHELDDDETHAHIVAWVLRKLREHNIQAAPRKAFFGRKEVKFLGHIAGEDGLKVDPEKVEAIKKMPAPTDVTGIKRVLGMCGYYRKFVPNFGQRTANMTDLLRKENKFEWGKDCEAEFEDLKTALSEAPALLMPRWNLPFIVRTDASDAGMGVILLQCVDGEDRIVACASRKWGKYEKNWDVRRKEVFCSLYGCRKFDEYLRGSHFTLETDHKNMLWVQKVAHTTPQLYRWALEFSCMNFTVKHVPGAAPRMAAADALSRAPLDETVEHDEEADWVGYSIGAIANDSANVDVKSYNTMLLGYGIGCDVMATENTPFTIIGGCEIDPVAQKFFQERTKAPEHGDTAELLKRLKKGQKLPPVHVLSSTMSCSSRSRFNRINKKDKNYGNGNAFNDQIELVQRINPKIFYCEMAPPDSGSNDMRDYVKLETELVQKCKFKHVTSFLMHMAEYGAYTDRTRYVVVASNTSKPFEIPVAMKKFPGCKSIMIDPDAVPVSYRANCSRTRMQQEQRNGFASCRIGTATRGDGSSAECLHNRLYDPMYPMPTITSGYTYQGNKGSQWVLDGKGARQWTLGEECDIHNFDDEAKNALHQMPAKDALGYIARSFPVAPLAKLYQEFDRMLTIDDKNDSKLRMQVDKPEPKGVHHEPDAKGESTDEGKSDYSQSVGSASWNATIYTVLGNAVHAYMPTVDELRTAQSLDPNIATVRKYLKSKLSETQRLELLTTEGTCYHREAPFCFLDNDVVYYRNLIGGDRHVEFVVLLPETLIPRVLEALHDSPTYGHAGYHITYSVVRAKAYWKGMSKAIKTWIKNCDACCRSNTEIRKHAGKPVSNFYVMPMHQIGLDIVGPLPVNEQGENNIFHAQCWATDFSYCKPIKGAKAIDVATALRDFYLLFGCPVQVIVRDKGTEFCNEIMDILIQKFGCKAVTITAGNPKANSRTERRHRDLNKILRTICNKYGKAWREGVLIGNWCINYRPRAGTDVCAFQRLLGYKPRAPCDGARQITGPNKGQPFDVDAFDPKKFASPEMLIRCLDEHRAYCMHICKTEEIKMIESKQLQYDRLHYTVSFGVGDLVLLARKMIGKRSVGTATRLLYQNIGPFEVMEKISDVTYRLRKCGTDKVTSHHVKFMNPYLTKDAHEQQIEEQTATTPGLEPPPLHYKPDEGDFLLFTQFATAKRPFELVQVVEYDSANGDIVFQYLNNTINKAKYKFVWTNGKHGALHAEQQKATCPKGYTASVQYAHEDCFCMTKVDLRQNDDKSFRLNATEIKRALSYKPALGK